MPDAILVIFILAVMAVAIIAFAQTAKDEQD